MRSREREKKRALLQVGCDKVRGMRRETRPQSRARSAPSCPLLAPFCPALHSLPVPCCLAYRAPAALWPALPVLCMAFRRNLLSVSGLRRPGQGERNGRQAGGGGGLGIRNDGSGD
jgi:hypothetical protein